MKKYITRTALILLGAMSLTSCGDEFLETQFSNSEQQSDINSVEKMQAFVYGNYATMRDFNYYGNYFITVPEVRSDEMYSNNRSGYHSATQNYAMTSGDAIATGAWTAMYTAIAKSNMIINASDNLSWGETTNPADISDRVKYLKGQAYALRAQVFFDLLRLYGQKYTSNPEQLGVVLPLQYNPSANMPRASVVQTEAQIEADFEKAYQYMVGNPNNIYSDKTVLNEYSVRALMSRYYLYKGNYARVRTLVADIVASNNWAPVKSDSYVASFALNNAASNSMFELAVGASVIIAPSLNDFLNGSGGYKNMVVKTAALNSYLPNDVRRDVIGVASGVSGRFLNGKYPSLAGDNNIRMVRIEEVLLNGIEAELNGGSATVALDYYKELVGNRWKSYTSGGTVITVEDQLNAITSVDMTELKKERTRELIGEGFRMWDLLRWGTPLTKNTTTGGTNGPAPLNLIAFPTPQIGRAHV